jgi:hypothetical protein
MASRPKLRMLVSSPASSKMVADAKALGAKHFETALSAGVQNEMFVDTVGVLNEIARRIKHQDLRESAEESGCVCRGSNEVKERLDYFATQILEQRQRRRIEKLGRDIEDVLHELERAQRPLSHWERDAILRRPLTTNSRSEAIADRVSRIRVKLRELEKEGVVEAHYRDMAWRQREHQKQMNAEVAAERREFADRSGQQK